MFYFIIYLLINCLANGKEVGNTYVLDESLLRGVYAGGNNRSPTEDNCVTCGGLTEWWSLFLTK